MKGKTTQVISWRITRITHWGQQAALLRFRTQREATEAIQLCKCKASHRFFGFCSNHRVPCASQFTLRIAVKQARGSHCSAQTWDDFWLQSFSSTTVRSAHHFYLSRPELKNPLLSSSSAAVTVLCTSTALLSCCPSRTGPLRNPLHPHPNPFTSSQSSHR